jgi:hypothetical protein
MYVNYIRLPPQGFDYGNGVITIFVWAKKGNVLTTKHVFPRASTHVGQYRNIDTGAVEPNGQVLSHPLRSTDTTVRYDRQYAQLADS